MKKDGKLSVRCLAKVGLILETQFDYAIIMMRLVEPTKGAGNDVDFPGA